MEPVIFSLLVAWALVRYGATDLVATARGTESPRYRERRERQARQHERWMARTQRGPTIGQAVAARIANRIAHPKPPRDRTTQGPFRRFLGEWWEDSWNHATERRHRHYQRKHVGELPRQRAWRATQRAYRQWRQRHDATASGTATNGATTPDTGPIHVVAERLPPANATADARGHDDNLGSWIRHTVDPEHPCTEPERNTATMTDDHVPDTAAAPSGEVTNIGSALDYTRGMAEQFHAATSHAEALAAQATQMSTWSTQSSAGAESAVAGITSGEVTGEAVERLTAAHEQMIAAADCVHQAVEALQLAQEQFAATAEGFDAAHHAFERQQTVAEAYAANPDAGSKQFNTYA
ncbi:MAG: hypothetical protein GEV04_21050 [Actinophytocola sp.]|nr:hypothetical protein [Actinophytocola sp.]